MIEKIKLYNWKSYREGTLYIDPLTIIIGTNSSGKSNALDALSFLSRISNGIGILQSISGDVTTKSLRGGIDWICNKPSDWFSIEVLMDYEGCKYEYTITIEIGVAKALVSEEKLVRSDSNNKINIFYTNLRDEQSVTIPAYFSTGRQGKGQHFELNRNICILFQAKTLQLKKKDTISIVNALSGQLKEIFILDPIPSHMRDYAPLSEVLSADASNIAGVLAALAPERKKEIENKITKYLKKIPEKDIAKIWSETIGKFHTDAMLYCEECWSSKQGSVVDARGMSDGTLRFLAIVTAMLTKEPDSLLVIEEVDNGLHPSRAAILLNMLKELGEERNIDVIITTHNPALLDAAGIPMIPFVTVAHRDKNGQSVLTLMEDIKELPKLISADSIGELVTNGKIESSLARQTVQKLAH